MKRNAYILFVILIGLIVSCNRGSRNNSQQSFGPGGGMGPGNFDPQAFVNRQMDELKEALELTKDQEKKVREIISSGFETMQKAREEMRDGSGNFEGMREKMQKMREEQNEKIKEVLSDEQWTKYDEIQKEMRERMRQGGGPGGQGGPGRPE